jgi:hypothetical protein
VLLPALAAVSLQAATPVMKIQIGSGVLQPVEVSIVGPKEGGNDDNCIIKLYEGTFAETPTGEVDILRILSLKKQPKNDVSTIHAGSWTCTFAGFSLYCEPKLRIKILDGDQRQPPMVEFVAKGLITSGKIEFKSISYLGRAGQREECFKFENGMVTISYPK